MPLSVCVLLVWPTFLSNIHYLSYHLSVAFIWKRERKKGARESKIKPQICFINSSHWANDYEENFPFTIWIISFYWIAYWVGCKFLPPIHIRSDEQRDKYKQSFCFLFCLESNVHFDAFSIVETTIDATWLQLIKMVFAQIPDETLLKTNKWWHIQ